MAGSPGSCQDGGGRWRCRVSAAMTSRIRRQEAAVAAVRGYMDSAASVLGGAKMSNDMDESSNSNMNTQ
jgi:hypothetical protein